MTFLIIYFSQQTLYKTQVKELREEVDEKAKQLQELSNEIRQLHEERWVNSSSSRCFLTTIFYFEECDIVHRELIRAVIFICTTLKVQKGSVKPYDSLLSQTAHVKQFMSHVDL